MLKNFLEHVGICPERVQFSWVSAAEGARFASLVDKVVEDIKKIGPNKILTVSAK
jgi:coenzyme F420-reducing hydrogenase delta subunit